MLKIEKNVILYLFISLDFLDAPYCKPDQVQVFGVARDETARIACEVIANPQSSVYFEWKFNTSGTLFENSYYLFTILKNNFYIGNNNKYKN